MKDQKEEAIDKCREILSLHFDCFVIACRASDDGSNDSTYTDWHGSITDVMGLNRLSQIRIEDIASGKDKDEDDEHWKNHD